MSKHMSNRMWDGMRDNLSDRLPARTPNRMSEYMPDKMRNRISEFMLIYLFPWESHETKQFLQDISSTACIVNLFAFPSLRNHPSRTSKVRCCHSSLWPVFVWSLNDVIICFVLNDSYLYTYIYIYTCIWFWIYICICFLRIVAWFMVQTALWFQDVSTLRSTIAANGPISRGLSY